MIVVDTLHPLPPLATQLVATIGFFDGVHLGHQYLIRRVCQEARRANGMSAVVTFVDHPRMVIQPEYCPALITPVDEKLRCLSDTGVDCCILLRFTPQLANLSPARFMAFLHEAYHIDTLVMGYDHHFGHHDEGHAIDYAQCAASLGMGLVRADECKPEGGHVSSTAIRQLIVQGEMEKAEALLGRPYTLLGTVIKGHGEGRKLGFPTANLSLPACKLIPRQGVYAARACTDTQVWPAMVNIGVRPTIGTDPNLSIEVHLINYMGNLYGTTMAVELCRFMRPEQKFPSLQALVRQLQADKHMAMRIVRHG